MYKKRNLTEPDQQKLYLDAKIPYVQEQQRPVRQSIVRRQTIKEQYQPVESEVASDGYATKETFGNTSF